MTHHSVIHDTFSIERTYGATPADVFAAFSTEEARNSWGDADGLQLSNGAGVDEVTEFDFRVGGWECFTTRSEGTAYRYDGQYHEITASRRIVYSYAMHANDALISVSLATIELAETGDGTKLTWTEQGVFLDGHSGADAPAMRRAATVEMIEGLTTYLQSETEQ
jgi:uncharacterized protein YndB with AHSA1/START domain